MNNSSYIYKYTCLSNIRQFLEHNTLDNSSYRVYQTPGNLLKFIMHFLSSNIKCHTSNRSYWKSLMIVLFYTKLQKSDKRHNIWHIVSKVPNFWNRYRFGSQIYLYFSFVINIHTSCNEDINNLTYSWVRLKGTLIQMGELATCCTSYKSNTLKVWHSWP